GLAAGEHALTWHAAPQPPPQQFDEVAHPLHELACGVSDHYEEPELAEGDAILGEERPPLWEEEQQTQRQSRARNDEAGVFVEVERAIHAASPRSTVAPPPSAGIWKCMLLSRRVVRTCRL